MKNRSFEPPLRLVLTGRCNGHCSFCHQEGNPSFNDMPLKMVFDCIDSADKLSITKIALTGGEPTLRNDLKDIIQYIQNKSYATISLTTNGYQLNQLSEEITKPIDNLNLSMYSLQKELAEKYQNVSPSVALTALQNFKALNKTINLYVTEENFFEVNDFIHLCKDNNFSLDFMFSQDNNFAYRQLQKQLLNNLINTYKGELLLQSTPMLKFKLNENTFIRVKHPYLNKLLHNGICDNCEQYALCFEKVCAIRVHPDGLVTPCLLQTVCAPGKTIYTKIQNAYLNLFDLTLCDEFF